MEESLSIVGGFGKFQWFVAVSFVLGHLTGPMIVNGLTFLTSEPKAFQCLDDKGVWFTCSKSYICDQGLNSDQYRADTSDGETYDNFIEKFDLVCS